MPEGSPNQSKYRVTKGLKRHSSLEWRHRLRHYFGMLSMDDLVGEEWAEWYRLTPARRWRETEKLWHSYLMLGGSLDPEPDTQSPFFDPRTPGARPSHGRPGMRIVRRGRV
jgi:hypothetical protein